MYLNKKQNLDNCLQRIANVLLLNTSLINNIGLLNGKMGIAIFFFHYSRYTGNVIYERYAGELIDEVYEEINLTTPVYFSNGLAGIGWGIAYLVNNGYLECNTDEVLVDIDNAIFNATMESTIPIQDQKELYGFGLFYLSRLKGREHDNYKLNTLKKKQFLLYLMDECERILNKDLLFDVPVSVMTLSQINSLLWFILKTRRLALSPVKSDKLVNHLFNYIEATIKNGVDSLDKTIFCRLTDELMKLVDRNLQKKYKQLEQTLTSIANTESLSGEKLDSIFIKEGWYSLLYDMLLSTSVNKEYDNILAMIFNKGNWNHRLDKLNQSTMGLDMGMAGLGIALLNIGVKDVSRKSFFEFANIN